MIRISLYAGLIAQRLGRAFGALCGALTGRGELTVAPDSWSGETTAVARENTAVALCTAAAAGTGRGWG